MNSPDFAQAAYQRGSLIEPRWRPYRRLLSPAPHACERAWLLDRGSLTQHLVSQNRGEFTVRLLRQDWQVPRPSERSLLGMRPRAVAMVREVMLMQGPQAVVFARSVLPANSLEGKLAHLRRLGNRPLGDILFRTKGVRRGAFELALIDSRSHYLPPGCAAGEPVWGRRSRFELYGKAIMVSEVFLHDFEPWTAAARRTQGIQRAGIKRANQ